MQFNQPTSFQPTNYGQPYGFNNPSPFQFIGYPDIIGEGNVTSIVSPDGNLQLLFMPTAQWSRSSPQTSRNFNIPYINYLGAWFVRNIYNPIQQPTSVFSPSNSAPYGFHYPSTSTSDCCLNNLPAPTFPLKFHNDNCTSTSDINYFLPKQYNWYQSPKRAASVQVDVPDLTVRHNEVICTRPCNCRLVEPCSCSKQVISEQTIKCMCNKLQTSDSEMSIEEAKSDCDCQDLNASKSRRLKRTKSKKFHAKYDQNPRKGKSVTIRDKKDTLNSNKLKRKPSYSNCNCKEQTATDKSVTTYTDQTTNCMPEKGQETQTVRKNSKSELEIINGHSNKLSKSTSPTNDLKSDSYSTLGQCECVGMTCSTCTCSTTDG